VRKRLPCRIFGDRARWQQRLKCRSEVAGFTISGRDRQHRPAGTIGYLGGKGGGDDRPDRPRTAYVENAGFFAGARDDARQA
jgi:hypothetical protein